VMKLGIVASAHGFGHLTRQLALGRALSARGVARTYFTHAPAHVVHSTDPSARLVPWTADVGIAQRDGLTEDLSATRARLGEIVTDRRIDALAAQLADVDFVLVDAAPPALEACRRARRPCLAIGNFDWAWIYRHYPALSDWAEQYAAWQAPHDAISLWPGPGMTGFRSVRSVGLVGRRAPAQPLPEGSVLVSFGGFGLHDLDARLPRLPGVTWVMAPPMPRLSRPDVHYVDGVPYPSLVAGADVVLTKPGYGIFAEASLSGTRIGWWPRGAFPEAPFLEQALRDRGDRALSDDLRELPALLASPAPAPRPHDLDSLVEHVLSAARSAPTAR